MAVITTQRVLIYTVNKLHQQVSQLLARYDAMAVKQFLGNFLDEVDVIELFIYLNCCSEQIDVAQQLLLTKQCLIQFNINQDTKFQSLNCKTVPVLEDCIKYNQTLFIQGMQQLIGKLL